MELISTVTVGAGGAANITFNSIPGTYTDLLFLVSLRTGFSSDHQYVFIEINSSGTGYTARRLIGDGSGAASYSDTTNDRIMVNAATSTANTFGNGSILFPNYAGSTNKSYSADLVTENNATLARQNITAGLWSNTSAITSVNFNSAGQTFQQNSTISLYGILKGSGGATVS